MLDIYIYRGIIYTRKGMWSVHMKSFGLWYQTVESKMAEETPTCNQCKTYVDTVGLEDKSLQKILDEEADQKETEKENPCFQEHKKSLAAEGKKPEFNLHVNFWSFEDIDNNRKIKTPYLDIGLQINNYRLLNNVTLYCPFPLDENQVEDLSSKLELRSNACIIFNDECEIETKGSYTFIELGEKHDKLLVFPLEQVIEDVYRIERTKNNEGARLVFQFEKFNKYVRKADRLDSANAIYIRFRIKSPELKEHIYFDSEPLNKSFESAFSGTRIIDFKVNEKRNIDDDIKAEVLINHEWARFCNIHFLVMVPSSYDLISFYKEPMTCRELEKDLWDDYLGTKINFSKGHVLAYHWRAKQTLETDNQENRKIKPVEDFSCLVKVNYSRAKLSTILAYASSVIALGILSSCIVTSMDKVSASNKAFGLYCLLMAILFFVFTIFFSNYKKR